MGLRLVGAYKESVRMGTEGIVAQRNEIEGVGKGRHVGDRGEETGGEGRGRGGSGRG